MEDGRQREHPAAVTPPSAREEAEMDLETRRASEGSLSRGSRSHKSRRRGCRGVRVCRRGDRSPGCSLGRPRQRLWGPLRRRQLRWTGRERAEYGRRRVGSTPPRRQCKARRARRVPCSERWVEKEGRARERSGRSRDGGTKQLDSCVGTAGDLCRATCTGRHDHPRAFSSAGRALA